jgi:hypothetical protein
MLKDPNVERYVSERLKPLEEQIKEMRDAQKLHLQNRELLIALKECRKWMINKGVNIESEFFKNIEKTIDCNSQ